MKTLLILLGFLFMGVSTCVSPDFAPALSVLPASFTTVAPSYTRALRIIVRVNETVNVSSDGTAIVVRIPKTSNITFTYNPSLGALGATVLQNSLWAFSDADPIYWEFTYTGVFPDYGESKFGFNATFNSFGQTGQLFINSIIVDGSGGETNFNNNFDSEVINYISN